MVDIFEKPEFCCPNCASGVRGPFRCAQEDYLKIFMTSTTVLAIPGRFCHARVSLREHDVLFAALKRTT